MTTSESSPESIDRATYDRFVEGLQHAASRPSERRRWVPATGLWQAYPVDTHDLIDLHPSDDAVVQPHHHLLVGTETPTADRIGVEATFARVSDAYRWIADDHPDAVWDADCDAWQTPVPRTGSP